MTVSADKMDRVIAKIKKLLALGSDRNDNEAEASAAMSKAQSLMSEYNLEMATVEASGGGESAGGKRTKEQTKGRAMYAWQKDLMRYVAHANFCHHIVTNEWYQVKVRYCSSEHFMELKEQGGWRYNYDNRWDDADPEKAYVKGGEWRNRPQHIIVGREANVISARLMFDYLCSAVERLVPIENNAQRLSRWALSWKEGCGDRLCNRLWERRDSLERAQKVAAEAQRAAAQATGQDTGSAMVLLGTYAKAETDANWEFAHGYAPGTLVKWKIEGDERRKAERARAQMEAEDEAEALAAMTPEKRAKHLAKKAKDEAKEEERSRQAEERRAQTRRAEERRKWSTVDHSAYRAGSDAGSDIGLDPQLGAADAKKRLTPRS